MYLNFLGATLLNTVAAQFIAKDLYIACIVLGSVSALISLYGTVAALACSVSKGRGLLEQGALAGGEGRGVVSAHCLLLFFHSLTGPPTVPSCLLAPLPLQSTRLKHFQYYGVMTLLMLVVYVALMIVSLLNAVSTLTHACVIGEERRGQRRMGKQRRVDKELQQKEDPSKVCMCVHSLTHSLTHPFSHSLPPPSLLPVPFPSERR